MTIVANFAGVINDTDGKDDDDFEITLCHVAVMGSEYIRVGSLPDSIFMYTGDTQTLTLDAITSKYTIGNTLDIRLRQKAGEERSFVSITQGDPHTIEVAPQTSDTFEGDIYFESIDANSNAETPSVLKYDTVSLTVRDSACKPIQAGMTLAFDFNKVDELEWIVEYKPKIYFP